MFIDERAGNGKTSWQIITIIFFLAFPASVELRYANETFTWWYGPGAKPVPCCMDYDSADDLLWVWRHLAQSRTDRARPIAAIERSASAEGREKCEGSEN